MQWEIAHLHRTYNSNDLFFTRNLTDDFLTMFLAKKNNVEVFKKIRFESTWNGAWLELLNKISRSNYWKCWFPNTFVATPTEWRIPFVDRSKIYFIEKVFIIKYIYRTQRVLIKLLEHRNFVVDDVILRTTFYFHYIWRNVTK